MKNFLIVALSGLCIWLFIERTQLKKDLDDVMSAQEGSGSKNNWVQERLAKRTDPLAPPPTRNRTIRKNPAFPF